jgi:phage tail-like protein
VRPDFSVAPFESMPISYSSLHLTWHNPVSADCTQLRLVRNGNNLPQDENDGAQVFVESNYATTNTNDAIPTGFLTSVTDIGLAGGFIYYTMFGWSQANSLWIRCTDLIALVPFNWGYGWRLYNLLPMAYRDADIVLVDPYNPWPVESPNPPLQRYLQLIGFQVDFIRTELESLMSISDAQNCSGALLPLMAQQLGLPHEPEVGMQQERQLVQSAVHLYKQKGSPRGITETVSILTSYPTTQLVHHGYNCLLCLDDGIMYDAIGTWQVWPPRIPNAYTGVLGPIFPALGGQATGIALTWIPNLMTVGSMTNPLTTYPGGLPLSLQPVYNNSGMRIQATGAGDYSVTTGGIPITDFMSQVDGQGHITWRIQVWSSLARTVWLSVWGDVGSGARVNVLPEQSFTETAGQWTQMTITGTINPYPNSVPGAAAPTGPASYYTLYPQIRIAGAGANEAHYVTLCGLWPCTPAQIGVDTPAYDYPRDVKILLQPQSSNLLSNTVTTFARPNPNPPPTNVGIGFDGLSNAQDPKAPISHELLTPQQSSLEDGTTTGWVNYTNATLTNSTNQAFVGTHSLALTALTAADMDVLNSPFGTAGIAITPGMSYTFTVNFRATTTSRLCYAIIQWLDGSGTLLTNNNGTAVSDTTTGWTTITNVAGPAPANARYAQLAPYVSGPAAGEIHYIDGMSFRLVAPPLSCNMSIRYASIEDPPALTPVNGTAALQINATNPNATIWWGKTVVWSPPPPTPYGWFAGSRPTPPPAYTDGHTNDWYFGASTGTSPRNWTDPTYGWFMTNQSFFGVGSSFVNGVWFALTAQPPNYGNLSAYNVAAGQPFNFSVYAQYVTVQDPSNAQMLLGLRWYYPDGTWVENTYPVMLTDTYQRYSMPNPSDPTSYYLGEPPAQANPPTGILPTLVYPFVRFPAAQNAQFLVNSAMLSPDLALSPYMDATSFSSTSGDFLPDPVTNASYIYRRRTPRVARLNEQLYRWLPMGSTYTITYASSAVTPPLDPTLWP